MCGWAARFSGTGRRLNVPTSVCGALHLHAIAVKLTASIHHSNQGGLHVGSDASTQVRPLARPAATCCRAGHRTDLTVSKNRLHLILVSSERLSAPRLRKDPARLTRSRFFALLEAKA